jgi:hypothetical protein
MSIRLGLVDDDGIEQTFSTHRLDQRTLNSQQPIPEQVTELLRAFDHLLLLHDFERANGNGAAKWVSTVRRTVGTRLDREHDVLASQHTGDRVHTAGNGLSEQDQVGLDSAPLVAEQLAGACNAGLDLVADQQHIILVAECPGFLQVFRIWDDDAGLSLDGFDEESG